MIRRGNRILARGRHWRHRRPPVKWWQSLGLPLSERPYKVEIVEIIGVYGRPGLLS